MWQVYYRRCFEIAHTYLLTWETAMAATNNFRAL